MKAEPLNEIVFKREMKCTNDLRLTLFKLKGRELSKWNKLLDVRWREIAKQYANPTNHNYKELMAVKGEFLKWIKKHQMQERRKSKGSIYATK